jgi:adenylate kinase family enzyme
MLQHLYHFPITVVEMTVEIDEAKRRMLARGRADDTSEIIEKRFTLYKNYGLPAIQYLRYRGLSYHQIDANLRVEDVRTAFLEIVEDEKVRLKIK